MIKVKYDKISEELRFFRKWFLIAFLIGIVSGVAAVTFHYAIEISLEYFLEEISGYVPPRPGPTPRVVLPKTPSLIIVSTVLGGILSGILVFKFAPEAEGHGTDAIIDAFHYKEGRVRPRVPFIKLIASAITIGSGGSAGKEGPVAQIGGGVGSLLAEKLKLSTKDKRIALAIGMGSGIGAIFKAPFGGAIFASEVLYLMDFEPEVLPPAFVASLVGYLIVGTFTGWKPIFWSPSLVGEEQTLNDPFTLLMFTLLGILNGIIGVIYIKTFYGVRKLFNKIQGIPNEVKPAIGALVTGVIGMFFPQVLESSYGWLQMAINGDFTHLPLTVLLVLPFLKILATSFSIGSGGSGGVFAPSLVIGGSIGALIWHIAKIVEPQYPIPVAAYVIIGMMSFFGGVGKVPIATILMVAEMTGEYELFAPALISTALSYILTGKNSIYISQLYSRLESPAHGGSKIALLRRIYDKIVEGKLAGLGEVKVSVLAVKPIAKMNCRRKIKDILEIVRQHPFRYYPIVDAQDRFLGFIRAEDVPFHDTKLQEKEILFLPILKGVTAREDEKLIDVLRKMLEYELDKAAIVDENNKLVGILTAKEILKYLAEHRGYKKPSKS